MAMMDKNTSTIENKFSKLSVNSKEESNEESLKNTRNIAESYLYGFDLRELYKIALNFYKEKEGKAVHLSYEDKLKLVAYTQQVAHGRFSTEKSPELGVLDVIGKDRRTSWQALGDISKEDAMKGFIILLDKLCPLFKTVVEAKKRDNEEKLRLKKEEELRKTIEEQKLKELEEIKKREEEECLKQEQRRRLIQEALNQQTYYQFRSYAEQQYPGNPEQQGVLIRQLQEQHYHQYMQQLQKDQLIIDDENEISEKENLENSKKEDDIIDEENINVNVENQLVSLPVINDDDSDEAQSWPPIAVPEMWTRKGIEEFKDAIRREAGDAVLKVGHGETVTVRVPTLEDGTCLFWEFATDGYDIGFGVYFEWSKPDTNQVSVHISESEDDDEDEDEYESKEDLESGASDGSTIPYKPSRVPISVIVPVYRRDCQEEVYAGSHQYPDQGVYLLKFDNSYSLWRSKTLYYKIYYTKPAVSNEN